jgi:hypothetical protein
VGKIPSNKVTTESFIQRSVIKHENKYDYSKSVYINKDTKIEIICPKHGSFFQRPHGHLHGFGCPKCADESSGDYHKSNKEEFVNKANKIHNNFYNYDKVEYINARKHVTITCNIHGDFNMVAHSHLQGHGCRKCKEGHTYQTKEEFHKEISKYIEVDIEDIKYTGFKQFCSIKCNKHGYYGRVGNEMLENPFCPTCIKVEENKKLLEGLGFENISFEKTTYESSTKKNTFICLIHGEFYKSISSFRHSTCGCSKCSMVQMAKNKRIPREDILARLVEIHNDKYDYSETFFESTRDRVSIICPIHGEFKQKLQKHLEGCGCQKCSSSKGEKAVMRVLKNLNLNYTPQYSFEDCRSVLPLRFDFGLLENSKLIGLVEYQGQQHFEMVPWSSSPEKNNIYFEKTLYRDGIKRKYCEDNKIPILYITYKENKYIKVKIEEFLKSVRRINDSEKDNKKD